MISCAAYDYGLWLFRATLRTMRHFISLEYQDLRLPDCLSLVGTGDIRRAASAGDDIDLCDTFRLAAERFLHRPSITRHAFSQYSLLAPANIFHAAELMREAEVLGLFTRCYLH